MKTFDYKNRKQILNLIESADDKIETQYLLNQFETLKRKRKPFYLDMDDFVNGFGSAYIDAYTCGEDCIPMIGINYLIDRLCTDESIVSMKVLKRGLDSGIIDLSEMCEGMC